MKLLSSQNIDLCFANEDEAQELMRGYHNSNFEESLVFLANYYSSAMVMLGSKGCMASQKLRRPNVQQPLHAENGAENQPIGAENQPQEVAIDAPQVGEQVDGHRQPVVVIQPAEQSTVFDDLQAENPPVMDHWVRRSTRVTRPPDRYEPSLDYVMLIDCGEPSCYKEAMQREDSKKWFKAMVSEMQSLEKNHTWDLVDLPPGHKALPCKWVYKKKVTSDAASKYKARLVAKGYKQKHGVDFDEIFSPVVKLATLRLVLGLVAFEDMELKQMEVKTAFLHGDLLEMIYMMQPEGFVSKGQEKKGQQTHEVGDSSRPPQTEDEFFRTQLVVVVTMFTQVMQNPRFMALLQPRPSSQPAGIQKQKSEPAKAQAQIMAGHAPRNQFHAPGSVFGGAQTMMPNPMYGGIGMQPGFQSTQGHFGMPQVNFGMAGITNQQPNMASPGQINSGQGTQMNPNSVPMFQSLPYDNLTPLEKPTPYKEGDKGVTFSTFTGFDDRKKALSFLQQFDKAYAGGNFTEASKVRKAATYLTGNAGQWWTTLLLQGQAPSTWIYFK
ncbi:hypothetical protein L7F22_029671 [Adiantum nelumboides]|nr:hypothetical protein [Adiantum nelumboides]